MSRRTGPNSGPHCQGSWQQTPIVGQGKEFGYIFQQGPQLQTNRSNRLLSKPFCPHSNPLSCCCSREGGGDSLPPDWTSEEAEEVKRGEQECIRSGPKLNLKLCCPAVIQSHAGLRMLAADSLIWIECLENKAAFVLFYCNQLTPKLDSYLTEVSLTCAREAVKGQQLTGPNNPPTAAFTGLNAACLQCNLIILANWIKLFCFYLFTAVAVCIHRASPSWLLSNKETFSGIFRQAGIRLIMSPFRVHMIMVDCLQVFSDVLSVPGHGGRAWNSFTHAVVLF